MTKTRNQSVKLYPWLAPFAFLYGCGVRLRNYLFDRGLLPAETYPVPVICIGNLAVGGTGKTPHTEYLIRFLSPRYRVAVVSRGYKRSTRGFVLAGENSSEREIGDEPFQIKRKFPQLIVAVDADRRRAIRFLLERPEKERPEVILLDDALQHRYVRPSFTLLLTDFRRRYGCDRLLPAGRLREPAAGSRRADAIIVTKCNAVLTVPDYEAIKKECAPESHQTVFFTGIVYSDKLVPVFNREEADGVPLADIGAGDGIVLVSGIASPQPLIEELGRYAGHVSVMNFPDHHVFHVKDIRRIRAEFDRLNTLRKFVVVTEKDAARLVGHTDIENNWKDFFYYLPITINFRRKEGPLFQEIILNHIRSVRQGRS